MDDLAPSRDVLGDLAEGVALSRAARRDQTTKRILDAARKCFVASGFQGASMHQICAAAEMSPGALYRYFPSKEAIINAIAETDRREDMETFAAMFDNPSAVDGVVDSTMAYIRHIHARDMAPLFAEIRAESMRNHMICATCLEHRDGVASGFEAYLANAIATGQIEPDVELSTLLAMFMAIGEGFALNNLLALGVPEDQVETLVRAMVVAMLKPSTPAVRSLEK
jgi:AcrR family transcriptional regulator